MKIPLRVRKRFGQFMPYGFISVRARRVRPIPIEVLVDTGSPWISITPKDVMRINISISALKRATDYPEIALGGFKFWRYLLKKITVRIEDENKKTISINLPSISILWPTQKKPPKEIEHIPSILGCDFLTIGNFALHFDPNKQIAFLVN